MVVMDDADVDLAVEGALFGGFGTAGQRCTSLGTAIVHESIFDEFVSKLSERLESSPIGDPNADVLYGPMIHERFAERFEDWLGLIRDHHTVHGSSAQGRITSVEPARGLRRRPGGGDLLPPDAGRRRDGRRRHLLDRDVRADRRRRASSRRSTRRWSWPTGTATGCRRRSTRRSGTHAFRFRERITAGMVSVNNSTSGAEAHLPFGGNGKSGNGSRQSGIWVLDQFTRWQSMNWDYAGKLQKAQMDLVRAARRPGVPPVLMLLAEELLLLLARRRAGHAVGVRCWPTTRAGRRAAARVAARSRAVARASYVAAELGCQRRHRGRRPEPACWRGSWTRRVTSSRAGDVSARAGRMSSARRKDARGRCSPARRRRRVERPRVEEQIMAAVDRDHGGERRGCGGAARASGALAGSDSQQARRELAACRLARAHAQGGEWRAVARSRSSASVELSG